MDASGPASEDIVDTLGASHLKEVIQHYGEALRARRKGLDKLNVYPVPDGDTGTNMSLTVQSVLAELKNAAEGDMASVAAAISKGAIMGARGNSGAILAQALRGVAESVREKTSLAPGDLADAFELARNGAYESVLKPVEGTILTVLSAAASAARRSADEGMRLKEQVDHIREATADALARTPELLPVLKEAGVVDAGASGFLLFVDALRHVATGEPIPGSIDEVDDDVDITALAHTELSDLRYEIMFLLDGDDAAIPSFREAWSRVGDSIVVVGGDGLFNCHIHSDDIGAAIETALDFGRPRQIRITDLLDQVDAEHAAQRSHDEHHQRPCVTAVVAVVNGDGMSRIFRSFGVQRLVAGGQSMNPSVADLLAAVESSLSSCVIVLPNNKNIRAAADQLPALTDKTVVVVPTVSMVEGMSALVCYDADQPVETVATAMKAAVAQVVCGEVTQAVRDSTGPAGSIKEGDWLGIGPDGICVVAPGMQQVLCQLVETLTSGTCDLVTLIEGEGATAGATNALHKWIEEFRPDLTLEVHRGGQPLYPYLVGIE